MANNKFWRITIDTNPEDCNLKCIMCEEHSPYSNFIEELYKETGVKRRRMPFDWVVDIFEQAHQLGVKEIIPSTMGEPLLYKVLKSKCIEGCICISWKRKISISKSHNNIYI